MYSYELNTLIAGIVALLVGSFIHLSKKRRSGNRKTRSDAPEARGAWPIIGHMHLFRGDQLRHKTLGTMADKHGPIFTIKLGSYRVLVLSSWEMAKECFTIHDKAFATRPLATASRLMGYNYAMLGFTPYGDYWREIRKLTTLELLSSQSLELLKSTRTSETEAAIGRLYKLWSGGGRSEGGVLVDMKQWLGDLTHNVSLRMVGGKPCYGDGDGDEDVDAASEARRFKKAMRDCLGLFGVFVLSDAFPYLGWLDVNGYEKDMKRAASEMDALLEGWLREHKKRRASVKNGKEDQDFMDVMLDKMRDADISGYDSDTIIKATCLNLMLGGSDTTMVTLTWALSLLLNNPAELKKAQDELDAQVGKERKVEESDTQNLVYLQAVVKETLRLYPPNPIITFRAAIDDCTFSCGYHVPAGTQLMVNAWKIQRDGRVWPDPHAFKPERFLTSHKHVDVRGQSYELIPFSSGRRRCPGITLAQRVVHLALAKLLHSFDVTASSPGGVVDMTESAGLTNLKATPLQVLLKPRLDNAKLYE